MSPAVRVDAAQLERVLVNLIENALRYSSPADPVDVGVEVRAGDVVISVADRGPALQRPSGRRSSSRSTAAGGRRAWFGPRLAIARGFAGSTAGGSGSSPSPAGRNLLPRAPRRCDRRVPAVA